MESKKELFRCEKCNQMTKVHLTRKDARHRGFGCLNCKTAVEKGGDYYESETS